jgi:hypothetical protein
MYHKASFAHRSVTWYIETAGVVRDNECFQDSE